jgi:hypothetical protein
VNTFDPYDDPWMDDDQTILAALQVALQSKNGESERLKEAYQWAMGAIANQRDRIFVCAGEYCAPEQLGDLFSEACREKYMFGVSHLVDTINHSLASVELVARTGSLELLENVLEGMSITKDVSDNIIIGALKGDCLNIVQHYYPTGFGERHQGVIRFAARHNAIDCLRHYVTEPLSANDWDYCIELAFKDFGAQTIAFLWGNPPIKRKSTLTVEQYALNIAERLIGDRLPQRNSKAFECLRVCMRYLTWENLVADLGHRAGFQTHMAELCDLYQEPYTEQLKEHMNKNGSSKNIVRKI